MYREYVDRKQKNLKRKEVKKMKRLNFTTLALLVVALGGLLMYPVLASAVVTPNRTSYTIIEYARNAIGVLTGQVMDSLTDGINLEGNYYKVSSTVNYEIKNGKAYAHDSTTVSRTDVDNGSWDETTDVITYTRDAVGNLTGAGATGNRTAISYDQGDNVSTLQKGALTFSIINGQAEVEKWDFAQGNWKATFDENGNLVQNEAFLNAVNFATLTPAGDANLKSYSTGTTKYSYTTIQGATRTDNIQSSGKTWDFTTGTPPADVVVALSPLDGERYAVADFSSYTKFAYDAKGNLIGTPQEILYDAATNRVGIDADGDGILEEDPNGDGDLSDSELKFVGDLQTYMTTHSGSFSVSYTSGIRFDEGQQGWVTYQQNSFTSYALSNGRVLPDWTHEEYFNSSLQGEAVVSYDPQIEGEILSVVYAPEGELTSRQATQEDVTKGLANFIDQPMSERKKETAWLFVKDASGKIWALKFESDYAGLGRNATGAGTRLLEAARAYSVGATININGDVIENGILKVNSIN